MTSSGLFFTRGENWKLRNAPRSKNLVAFHPGNPETRHFCARYGSRDCWAATSVGSGQASNAGTRVPGFIQAMLAAGRWEPQSLIADTPQVPRNHREVSVNPTSCLTTRFSSALFFFFSFVRLSRQRYGSKGSKKGVLEYLNKLTPSANSHGSPQSHGGIREPRRLTEIKV